MTTGARRPSQPRALRLRWAFALPLLILAVLLQADAVVKSTVMNLLAFGEGAPCAMAMAGASPMAPVMAMRQPHVTVAGHKAPVSHAACSYCAAAAHAPILTASAPLQPSLAVAFAAFRTAAVQGPRGPPSVQPRARGPPDRLT